MKAVMALLDVARPHVPFDPIPGCTVVARVAPKP
jgi:hypothetical protein